MTRLFAAEIRRLLARRLFIVLTALILVGLSVAGVASFIASDDSAEAIAASRAERAAEIEGCVAHTRSSIDAGAKNYPPLAHEDPTAYCEEQVWVADPRFAYRDLNWILASFGVPILAMTWLIGASAVGAEWHNRTMTTLLTWEPRRVRVLAAKALAAMVLVFVWAILMQAAIAGAFYPTAEFEGTMAGIDAGWWGDLGLQSLRFAGISVVAALLGLSLATVGRNTAAALGVGVVHLAVVENLIRAFRPSWSNWLLGNNIELALALEEGPLGHSAAAAGSILAVYTLALLLVATAVFRRRDIA